MRLNNWISKVAIGVIVILAFAIALLMVPEIEASGSLGFSPYPPPNVDSKNLPIVEPYPAPSEEP